MHAHQVPPDRKAIGNSYAQMTEVVEFAPYYIVKKTLNILSENQTNPFY